MARRKGLPSQEKAAKILHDQEVRGHPLSKKQRGFFGVIASGKAPTKLTGQARRRRIG